MSWTSFPSQEGTIDESQKKVSVWACSHRPVKGWPGKKKKSKTCYIGPRRSYSDRNPFDAQCSTLVSVFAS
jgi:hypothetical protein